MSDPMRLKRGEAHCWYVDLDVPLRADLCTALTDDERSRGSRLRSGRDRGRFMVAHATLRRLLGRYLGTDPAALRFVRNAFGKPELGPGFRGLLNFNLSHSAGLAAIAVAHAEVGVDVECIQELPEYAEIARCFFSAAEFEQLNGLPSHLRAHAFLACWTRREAHGKACGEGLSSDRLGEPTGRWSLHALEPAPGYVGALAIEGAGWRLVERAWADGPTAVLPW
jgi:4'-phosphopantetheinyl transferase